MQFGVFTVGDITTDPTTGVTISEQFAARKPAHVLDAPTHASRLAARDAATSTAALSSAALNPAALTMAGQSA